MGINATLAAPLTQSYSSGANSSYNASSGGGSSETDAAAARAWSAEQARIAFEREKELMQMQMDYNSKEAKIARDWQGNMANTVYTRSVNNMKEAGINPILAANMGLSAGNIGSGQSASVAGHSAPMAQGFMDSHSSWSSQSHGEGSGWNKSESGIATALEALAGMATAAIANMNTGNTVNLYMEELKDMFDTKDPDKAMSKGAELIADATGQEVGNVKDKMMTKDSGKYNAMINNLKKNNPAVYKSPHRINESGW